MFGTGTISVVFGGGSVGTSTVYVRAMTSRTWGFLTPFVTVSSPPREPGVLQLLREAWRRRGGGCYHGYHQR